VKKRRQTQLRGDGSRLQSGRCPLLLLLLLVLLLPLLLLVLLLLLIGILFRTVRLLMLVPTTIVAVSPLPR